MIVKAFRSILLRISVILLLFNLCLQITAQETNSSDTNQNLYRPQGHSQNRDSIPKAVQQIAPDSINPQLQRIQDSIRIREAFIRDSIAIREAFIRDSIAIREAFVRDSIIKREAFIRDSIMKRKRRVDSLTFLKVQLPRHIEASLRSLTDEIIFENTPVRIVGDSILTDYVYRKLLFNLTKPYTPWQETLNLSTNPIEFSADQKNKTIKYIKFNNTTHGYSYNRQLRMLRIEERSIVLSKKYGKLFTIPVDSVFYDHLGRITQIKQYHHYYQVVGNYRKGAPMYSHLVQVKQYEYSAGNRISNYKVVKLCERWRKLDPEKVCSIISYTVSGVGSNYILHRKTDPANKYSDGKFDFVYSPGGTLKSVQFKNNSATEDWKTLVEVNEEGYVSRYVYITNGKANKTLLINYYLDDPYAKNKIETITCLFEDDKVSYVQINNTTKKTRKRDRLTMEWGPWQ